MCTCEDEGEMKCVEMTCPELNCEGDELVSYREDQCCPYCQSDWVEVNMLGFFLAFKLGGDWSLRLLKSMIS